MVYFSGLRYPLSNVNVSRKMSAKLVEHVDCDCRSASLRGGQDHDCSEQSLIFHVAGYSCHIIRRCDG